MPEQWAQWLLTVNVITFVTILGLGYRIIRFINRIEFMVDQMWADFEVRTKDSRADRLHRIE